MDAKTKLELVLKSQGVPKASWPATIDRMDDEQRKALTEQVDDKGVASSKVVAMFAKTLKPRKDKAKTLKPAKAPREEIKN